jgi:peptide-methionine (S)-S-oxide reductase
MIDRAWMPLLKFGALLLAGVAVAAFVGQPIRARQPVPEPAVDAARASGTRTAVFAGGCFWGVEAVFESLKGVRSARSGYAGGSAVTARYPIVSSGQTAHAEVVEVVYDPAVVSYDQLLKVFFSVAHDPTQLNRQGPDRGPQYRSAIFYRDAEQKRVAAAYIAQMGAAKTFGNRPIVTQLAPLARFFPAEPYHQDFARLNPTHPYIVHHDAPKLVALRRAYPQLVR